MGETRAALAADPDAPAVTWGIHTHNDAELAVANSMAAVAGRGIRHVQATINGYGERCGNANMVTILANLALKTPHPLVPAGGGDLAGLTELSRSVAEIANQSPERLPAVRRPVGVRPQGRRPRRRGREGRAELPARRPGPVGNEGRLVVSELGGKANTRIRAEQLGHQLEGVVDPQVLSELIKQLETEGLAFEGAEASFELLIRRHQPGYVAPFRIVDYTVPRRAARPGPSCGPRRRSRSRSTARCSTRRPTATARSTPSTPPCARRSGRSTRCSTTVHLVDYKVRILDGGAATAARTRVVIDSADGTGDVVHDGQRHEHHRGLGDALADSLEYAIWKSGAELRRRDERHFTTAPAGRGNHDQSTRRQPTDDRRCPISPVGP